LNTFHIYQKSGTGKEITNIADLIPVGRENAISRKSLVSLCIAHGLIDDSIRDKDRAMRLLVQKARIDYVILNLSNGHGYYRVSREDMQDLQRYIRQEDKRAKAAFKNITMARALYEDFIHERMGGDD
jgi:uncharacterized protein YecE (DUF72 family)